MRESTILYYKDREEALNRYFERCEVTERVTKPVEVQTKDGVRWIVRVTYYGCN